MPKNAYELALPRARKTSLVFASPHSGHSYNRAFLNDSALNEHTIRSSEDAFVDVLFNAAPRFGAPFLCAVAPRAYVDLNRSIDELDPALIEGVAKSTTNPRISSGLGVIPRVVANGRAIYNRKLTRAEAQARLDQVWTPFHTCLQALLDGAHDQFGQAILIDCHSMPHEAIKSLHQGHSARPDVVLGDRFGAAAAPEIVDQLQTSFESVGLKVARNTPFAGAFTARHYGHPSKGQHVVQIEIDRSLYMDEKKIVPNENFAEMKVLITQVVAEITSIGRQSIPLAAE